MGAWMYWKVKLQVNDEDMNPYVALYVNLLQQEEKRLRKLEVKLREHATGIDVHVRINEGNRMWMK